MQNGLVFNSLVRTGRSKISEHRRLSLESLRSNKTWRFRLIKFLQETWRFFGEREGERSDRVWRFAGIGFQWCCKGLLGFDRCLGGRGDLLARFHVFLGIYWRSLSGFLSFLGFWCRFKVWFRFRVGSLEFESGFLGRDVVLLNLVFQKLIFVFWLLLEVSIYSCFYSDLWISYLVFAHFIPKRPLWGNFFLGEL